MTNSSKKQSSAILLSSLLVSLGLGISGCSEHHETKAVDKVQEAAEMAKAEAPEAEVVELEDTATNAEATSDAQVADDGQVADEEMAAENAQIAENAAEAGDTQAVAAEVAEVEATDAGTKPASED